MYSRVVCVASAAGLVFALAGTASAGAPPVTGTVSCSTASGAITAKPAVGTGNLPSAKVIGTKAFKEKLGVVATATNCTGSQSGTKNGWPIEGAVLKAKVKIPFTPGICVGGDNDLQPCTADSECPSTVCLGGDNNGDGCTVASDCPGGGTCTSGVYGYPNSECGNRYPSCLALASGGFSFGGADIAPKALVKWTNTTDASIGAPKPKTKPVAKSTVASFDFGDAGTDPDIHVALTGLATKGAFLGQQVTADVHLDTDITGLLVQCDSCTLLGESCVDNGFDCPGPSDPKGCDKGTGIYAITFGAANSDCTKAGKPWPCCTGLGTGTCTPAATDTTVEVDACLGEGYGACTVALSDCCTSTACAAGVCCVDSGNVSPDKKKGGTDCCSGSCSLQPDKTCVCD